MRYSAAISLCRMINSSVLILMAICLTASLGCSSKTDPPQETGKKQPNPETDEQVSTASKPQSEARPEQRDSTNDGSARKKTPDSSKPPVAMNVESRTDSSLSAGVAVEPGTATDGKPVRSGKQKPDAVSTLKQVRGLREKVSRAKAGKEFGTAFDLASKAWETARTYPNDATLKKQAEELAVEIKWLGDQANTRFHKKAASSATRLTEQ